MYLEVLTSQQWNIIVWIKHIVKYYCVDQSLKKK
jgi:hypothetical protein